MSPNFEGGKPVNDPLVFNSFKQLLLNGHPGAAFPTGGLGGRLERHLEGERKIVRPKKKNILSATYIYIYIILTEPEW